MEARAGIGAPSWFDVAVSLLEESGRPTAVIDSTGIVRAVNHCLLAMLDRSRDELIGAPWPERDPRSAELRRIVRLSRGPRETRWTSSVTSGAGVPLTLELEATRVGTGRRAALLLSVRGCRVGGPDGAWTYEDLEYVIDRRASTFGTIASIRAVGCEVPTWKGLRCFEVIQGRKSPCPECPASNGLACGEARTAVLTPASPAGSALVVTARAVDARTARLTRFRVDSSLLARLVEAKTRALAEAAGLSPREREVLAQIVRGADAVDIGARLGIAVRTVKFHQARALEKLGADSRVDLLRLIF